MTPKKNNVVNFKHIALWILSFILLLALYQKMQAAPQQKEIAYSEFKQKLQAGAVKDITISAELIKGEMQEDGKTAYFKTIPVNDTKLVEQLEAGNVKFRSLPDRSWVTTMLWNVGGVLLFVFLWWFLIMRQAQAGGKQAMSFGRSRAKQQDLTNHKVTFADVAGCEEAKEELMDVIHFLKDPKKFQRLGGTLPKGVMLFGTPGTGKTLLARAVAGEAGVPFFTASASEFVEMFVGVGASRVRDLFEQAKRNPPAIIFIDELDAVGRRRFAGIGGGHDEREQTLNQLLVELDGFESKEGIILIGATNRPDVLDPALLRPGRFDRHINVPAPDLNGRLEILKVHAKKIKLDKDVDLSVVAKSTPGFVGADLANVINEAAILAARNDKKGVSLTELHEAMERVLAGPQKKSRVISEREKRIIAYHESGHALVAKLLPGCDPVHKVSIISRGHALGYTMQLPEEDKYLSTRSELVGRITGLLGGRAAEEIVIGDVTTGANDDLMRATAFARKMVTEFGMSERIGPVFLKEGDGEVFLGRDLGQRTQYSEATAKSVDEEVSHLVMSCYAKAKDLLGSKRDVLDQFASRLIEKEMLNSEELENILNPQAAKPQPAAGAEEDNGPSSGEVQPAAA